MKKLIILLACVFLLSSCERRPSIEEQYEDLQSEYYDVEEKYMLYLDKYTDLSADIARVYDDALTLKAYFLGWDEVTFEEAKQSIKTIYDRLYPGEW